MNSYDIVKDKVNLIYPEVVKIRRHFHKHPELSQQEENTCAFIRAYLNKLNIPNKQIAGHGVVATIMGNGKSNKTIGIRGDIDALPIAEMTGLSYASENPGVMHACGHDMHGAMLLGTAIILNELKDSLDGNVKLFFQPQEETIGGAEPMIKEGCLTDPNVTNVIGLHVEEKRPLGTIEFMYGAMNASTTEFILTAKGESCHGAHPDLGVDAVIIAANMITALQTIISRNLDPAEALVITIGTINGGTKENVISGEVVMTGTLRSLDSANRDFAKKRMTEICDGVAKAYGGSYTLSFTDSYPPLVNDNSIVDTLISTAAKIVGKENVLFRKNPSLGADDFSFFCKEVPSAYFNIGATDFSKGKPASAHSEKFNPEEECMKNGMLMEIIGAMELMKK